MIDLNELARESQEIAKKRAEHGLKSDTLTCLKHCAGEVVEANKAYNDWTFLDTPKDDMKKAYAEELADVIICILIAAANDNLDIEMAISEKVMKNRLRAEGVGDKL